MSIDPFLTGHAFDFRAIRELSATALAFLLKINLQEG